MRQAVSESLSIPEGISCEYTDSVLTCRKASLSLTKKIDVPGVEIKIDSKEITFTCKKASKREFKTIKSHIAHIKNLFSGLQSKFVYKLESCNVHFPMTLKIDGSRLLINNFLGEKTARIAKILPEVVIEIKGQKITITSANKDAAGQTAANVEKATKIRNRDRRVFQDGIYITEKAVRLENA